MGLHEQKVVSLYPLSEMIHFDDVKTSHEDDEESYILDSSCVSSQKKYL